MDKHMKQLHDFKFQVWEFLWYVYFFLNAYIFAKIWKTRQWLIDILDCLFT